MRAVTNLFFCSRPGQESTIEERIIERQKIKLKWDTLVLAKGKISAMENTKNKSITKNELKELISYGASVLFKATGGTFKDEDIDKLIQNSIDKAKQVEVAIEDGINKASENIFNLAMSGLDIYRFEGNDYLKRRARDEEAILEALDEESEMQRIRKRLAKAESSGNVETVPSRPRVKLPDYQFFEQKQKLEDLINKENLTDEEQHEKSKLMETGFRDWTKFDFTNLIKLLEKYGKDDYESVSKELAKSKDEVTRYIQVLFERFEEINSGDKIVKGIEKCQRIRDEKTTQDQALTEKLKDVGNFWEIDLDLNSYSKFRNKQFTYLQDCFLLFSSYRSPDRSLRDSILDESSFRFDFYFKSCKETNLKKRLQSLLKVISSETK